MLRRPALGLGPDAAAATDVWVGQTLRDYPLKLHLARALEYIAACGIEVVMEADDRLICVRIESASQMSERMVSLAHAVSMSEL